MTSEELQDFYLLDSNTLEKIRRDMTAWLETQRQLHSEDVEAMLQRYAPRLQAALVPKLGEAAAQHGGLTPAAFFEKHATHFVSSLAGLIHGAHRPQAKTQPRATAFTDSPGSRGRPATNTTLSPYQAPSPSSRSQPALLASFAAPPQSTLALMHDPVLPAANWIITLWDARNEGPMRMLAPCEAVSFAPTYAAIKPRDPADLSWELFEMSLQRDYGYDPTAHQLAYPRDTIPDKDQHTTLIHGTADVGQREWQTALHSMSRWPGSQIHFMMIHRQSLDLGYQGPKWSHPLPLAGSKRPRSSGGDESRSQIIRPRHASPDISGPPRSLGMIQGDVHSADISERGDKMQHARDAAPVTQGDDSVAKTRLPTGKPEARETAKSSPVTSEEYPVQTPSRTIVRHLPQQWSSSGTPGRGNDAGLHSKQQASGNGGTPSSMVTAPPAKAGPADASGTVGHGVRLKSNEPGVIADKYGTSPNAEPRANPKATALASPVQPYNTHKSGRRPPDARHPEPRRPTSAQPAEKWHGNDGARTPPINRGESVVIHQPATTAAVAEPKASGSAPQPPRPPPKPRVKKPGKSKSYPPAQSVRGAFDDGPNTLPPPPDPLPGDTVRVGVPEKQKEMIDLSGSATVRGDWVRTADRLGQSEPTDPTIKTTTPKTSGTQIDIIGARSTTFSHAGSVTASTVSMRLGGSDLDEAGAAAQINQLKDWPLCGQFQPERWKEVYRFFRIDSDIVQHDAQIRVPGLQVALTVYQCYGVYWMLRACAQGSPGCLLCDDPGFGKDRQMLAVMVLRWQLWLCERAVRCDRVKGTGNHLSVGALAGEHCPSAASNPWLFPCLCEPDALFHQIANGGPHLFIVPSPHLACWRDNIFPSVLDHSLGWLKWKIDYADAATPAATIRQYLSPSPADGHAASIMVATPDTLPLQNMGRRSIEWAIIFVVDYLQIEEPHISDIDQLTGKPFIIMSSGSPWNKSVRELVDRVARDRWFPVPLASRATRSKRDVSRSDVTQQ